MEWMEKRIRGDMEDGGVDYYQGVKRNLTRRGYSTTQEVEAYHRGTSERYGEPTALMLTCQSRQLSGGVMNIKLDKRTQ